MSPSPTSSAGFGDIVKGAGHSQSAVDGVMSAAAIQPGDDGLLDRVVTLVDGLRQAGIEVSTGAVIDAAAALGHLDLLDRPTFKAGLRATMVKTAAATERFDLLFERCFRLQGPTGTDVDVERTTAAQRPPGPDGSRPAGVSAAVLEALQRGDAEQLRLLAAQAVELAAGIDGHDASETYFLHRVLRAIDLSRMLSAAMRQARADGEMSELELSLYRTELGVRLEEFRRQLALQIAARLAEQGRESVELADGVTDPAQRDILSLSGAEMAELRRIVQPLARQLATRVGRRRRLRSTGRLDVRRTVRRSLQSGGVPLDVATRRRHPHRPDLVLLCDVSGSVADFAQFTFTLVHAIHDELSRVRSFAFVDGIGEVTDLFASAQHEIPVARFVERKGVLGPDGHSDYGRVFAEFARRYLDDAVTPRTTVLITGDARTNYRPSAVAELGRIAKRARRVYWLNPEPSDRWGTDDSAIGDYAPICQHVFEVRTLAQLADAISSIM